MPTNLFENYNLTIGEEEFVRNVLLDDYKTLEGKTVYIQQAQVLASLKLAKNLEKAAIANDRTSSRAYSSDCNFCFFARYTNSFKLG